MVWTSKWSCSSLRKQMTFMVAWSIPWTDSEFFWVSISSKIFSCGFEKGLKIEHPSSPKKKTTDVVIPNLIHPPFKQVMFNKPPPPWSLTLGYPKIHLSTPREVTYTWELLPQHRVVSSLVHSSELKSQSRQQTPRPEVVVPALCSLSWQPRWLGGLGLGGMKIKQRKGGFKDVQGCNC